ncbi:MFS transporter [Kineococcus sp. SYSU DK004]|uniref:MFS transporter n=1 Tax=Kineococcus sp. SYSU DK004 TaxID=3383125 RepID=UPI003D7E7F90
MLVFVSAGTPIPLYNTYRAQDGLTTADLTVATALYLAAAALSLLVLGRLSDHLGRRPLGVAALLTSAAGLGVLQVVDGLAPLAAGRLLQGLATGLASSALGALVVDTAPERPRWLAAVVTSAAPMLGIPLGALACGALVDHGPAPRHLLYAVVAVALVAVAAGVAAGPETVERAGRRAVRLRGAAASLRPRVHVPPGARRPLVAVAAVVVATWSLGGFYQAFGPTIARDELGSDAALTAAAVFASFTVLSALGGPLTARLRADRAVRVGAALYAAGVVGILAALAAGAVVPFLVVSLLTGVAQGAAQTGGMRTLLARTAPADRAGLLSTVFLLNYSSAAVPSLVAGRLTDVATVVQIASGYGVLVLAGVAVALVAARPARR